MESNQVNKKVKFSVHLYRTMLSDKAKLASELDKLHFEQNKEVMDRLVSEGLADSQYTPVGIVTNPQSEEDVQQMNKALYNFAMKYAEYKGKAYVELEQDIINKLHVSEEDILSCIIPEDNEA